MARLGQRITVYRTSGFDLFKRSVRFGAVSTNTRNFGGDSESADRIVFERVTDLFCGETGFQTPKLDTRAAIFQDGKILLVEERDGTWSLPRGWVDVNQTVKTNTEKEVLEEAGLEVEAVRLLALQDRNLHNRPPYAYNVYKAFVLCEIKGGSFRPNIETQGSAYFALDELPPLSEDKVTREQIVLCFEAVQTDDWVVPFD